MVVDTGECAWPSPARRAAASRPCCTSSLPSTGQPRHHPRSPADRPAQHPHWRPTGAPMWVSSSSSITCSPDSARRRTSRSPCSVPDFSCSSGGDGRGSSSPTSTSPVVSDAHPPSSPAANVSGWPLPGPGQRAQALLLADEPTGNLDDQAVDRITSLLDRLRAERPGLTMVVVTHDRQAVAASVDRIVRLRDGHVDDPGGGGRDQDLRQGLLS